MTAASRRSEPLPPWLPRWWVYYASSIALISVVALILGVVGVYTNGRQDAIAAAENKVRDEQNRTLLDCFDQFASDLSGGLPPVREATAAANQQLSEALRALQTGLVKVGTGSFEESDLHSIITEFGQYQDANDRLIQVRKNHPYPPAPSTFCPAD